MVWELETVGHVDETLDDSGIYTIIHRIVEHTTHKGIVGDIVTVRVDVMPTCLAGSQEPIRSFVGKANNVCKAVIGYLDKVWLDGKPVEISREHASYIGCELHRAETDPDYVQD